MECGVFVDSTFAADVCIYEKCFTAVLLLSGVMRSASVTIARFHVCSDHE